ncbi:hypothetical protein D1AOALGA4SA_12519 [Olavius algarvensis Delta 1 endosymbiont]|nr:hypothetical protein D1AOALGA4SA_12519 [Olavius algarvensis Delta 1 endosymbiont]
MLDAGYSMPDTRCWMLDAGCSMPDARCRILCAGQTYARYDRSAFGIRLSVFGILAWGWNRSSARGLRCEEDKDYFARTASRRCNDLTDYPIRQLTAIAHI